MGGFHLAVLAVFYADGPIAVEQHPMGQSMGLHGQVRPRHSGPQERIRCRRPPAVADGKVRLGNALGLGPVIIPALGKPGFLAGFGKQLIQRRFDVGRRGFQEPVAVMMFIRTAPTALGFLEVGQNIFVAPAGQAHLPPLVVVHGVAARIDHRVDRGRAAEDFASWERYLPAIAMGLGLGLEIPAQLFALGHRPHGDGHMNPEIAVLAAGFQQQNLAAGVLAQPVGEHTARRTRTDHNVIKLRHLPPVGLKRRH